jgi:small subunit ribosomal protein S16
LASKIKLQRKGSKKKPFFRVVVQDESSPTKGKVIEVLGKYNPLLEPSLFDVDKEKTSAWLAKGAEPTEKVRILLGKAGFLPPVDLAALPKRKPKAEMKAEETAAAEKKKQAPAAKAAEGKKETKEEKKEETKEEKKEEAKVEKKEEAKPEAKVETPEEVK